MIRRSFWNSRKQAFNETLVLYESFIYSTPPVLTLLLIAFRRLISAVRIIAPQSSQVYRPPCEPRSPRCLHVGAESFGRGRRLRENGDHGVPVEIDSPDHRTDEAARHKQAHTFVVEIDLEAAHVQVQQQADNVVSVRMGLLPISPPRFQSLQSFFVTGAVLLFRGFGSRLSMPSRCYHRLQQTRYAHARWISTL